MNDEVRQARERQIALDGEQAMASLAAEMVAMACNGADAGLMVERLQARMRGAGYRPIGVVGETSAFDPVIHEVMGPWSGRRHGAPVVILEPGYHTPTGGERSWVKAKVCAP